MFVVAKKTGDGQWDVIATSISERKTDIHLKEATPIIPSNQRAWPTLAHQSPLQLHGASIWSLPCQPGCLGEGDEPCGEVESRTESKLVLICFLLHNTRSIVFCKPPPQSLIHCAPYIPVSCCCHSITRKWTSFWILNCLLAARRSVPIWPDHLRSWGNRNHTFPPHHSFNKRQLEADWFCLQRFRSETLGN